MHLQELEDHLFRIEGMTTFLLGARPILDQDKPNGKPLDKYRKE